METLINRSWSPYIDEFGLIQQADKDRGDTCQRMPMFYFLRYKTEPKENFGVLQAKYMVAVHQLMIKPGIWVRHPQPKQLWWADPGNNSRDQEIPNVIAMGYFNLNVELKQTHEAVVRRWGFAQNVRDYPAYPGEPKYRWKIPDIYGPHHRACFWRSMKTEKRKKWLFVTDLFLLFSSFWIWAVYGRKPKNVDDNNQLLEFCQAHDIWPTLWSEIACWLYFKHRPFGVQYALNTYFDPSTNAPPMNELAAPYITQTGNCYKEVTLWQILRKRFVGLLASCSLCKKG